MRRLVVLVLTVATVGALALPASAAGTSKVAGYCRDAYEESFTSPITGQTISTYVVPVAFTFGDMTFVEPFSLASFQACVSTVAGSMVDGVVPASAIGKPAYLAQCDFLEAVGVIAYPYDFYGVYPADNRADCARILQGVHTGQLPLPEEPPIGS